MFLKQKTYKIATKLFRTAFYQMELKIRICKNPSEMFYQQ